MGNEWPSVMEGRVVGQPGTGTNGRAGEGGVAGFLGRASGAWAGFQGAERRGLAPEWAGFG